MFRSTPIRFVTALCEKGIEIVSTTDSCVIQLFPRASIDPTLLLRQADYAASVGDQARACELIESVYAALDTNLQQLDGSMHPRVRHVTLSELQLMSLSTLLGKDINELTDRT